MSPTRHQPSVVAVCASWHLSSTRFILVIESMSRKTLAQFSRSFFLKKLGIECMQKQRCHPTDNIDDFIAMLLVPTLRKPLKPWGNRMERTQKKSIIEDLSNEKKPKTLGVHFCWMDIPVLSCHFCWMDIPLLSCPLPRGIQVGL
jgi:hypothetical protein